MQDLRDWDFSPNLSLIKDEIVKDFLEKVLEPDPQERLGITDRGIDSLKDHKLFDQVNWGGLEDRTLSMEEIPFIPHLNTLSDTKYFSNSWGQSQHDPSLWETVSQDNDPFLGW